VRGVAGIVVDSTAPASAAPDSSPADDAGFAGVRFAAVVRVVADFAAVVFVPVVRPVVDLVVVRAAGFFVGADPAASSAPASGVAAVRVVLVRFAGAFVLASRLPVVRLVVRGARFGGVWTPSSEPSVVASEADAPWAAVGLGARGLVGVPSAGTGCSAGSGGVVEVTNQTYQ